MLFVFALLAQCIVATTTMELPERLADHLPSEMVVETALRLDTESMVHLASKKPYHKVLEPHIRRARQGYEVFEHCIESSSARLEQLKNDNVIRLVSSDIVNDGCKDALKKGRKWFREIRLTLDSKDHLIDAMDIMPTTATINVEALGDMSEEQLGNLVELIEMTKKVDFFDVHLSPNLIRVLQQTSTPIENVFANEEMVDELIHHSKRISKLTVGSKLLRKLESFPNLQELILSVTESVDLAAFTNLKKLQLNILGSFDVKNLNRLSNLKKLEIQNCYAFTAKPISMQDIKMLNNLEELIIMTKKPTEILTELKNELPNLTKLKLLPGWIPLPTRIISYYNTEYRLLYSEDVEPIESNLLIEMLQNKPKIKHLELSNMLVIDLQNLVNHLPNLNHLSLYIEPTNLNPIELFNKFNSLKLFLMKTKISSQWITAYLESNAVSFEVQDNNYDSRQLRTRFEQLVNKWNNDLQWYQRMNGKGKMFRFQTPDKMLLFE